MERKGIFNLDRSNHFPQLCNRCWCAARWWSMRAKTAIDHLLEYDFVIHLIFTIRFRRHKHISMVQRFEGRIDQFLFTIATQLLKHRAGKLFLSDVITFELNRFRIIVTDPDTRRRTVEKRNFRGVVPMTCVRGQITLFQMIIIEHTIFPGPHRWCGRNRLRKTMHRFTFDSYCTKKRNRTRGKDADEEGKSCQPRPYSPRPMTSFDRDAPAAR